MLDESRVTLGHNTYGERETKCGNTDIELNSCRRRFRFECKSNR